MLVLLGWTASGKDTIKRELIKLGMKSIVTYTTRPKRKGEKNCIAYNFITKEQFLSLKSKNFFVETTSYNVVSGERWYYGTARKDIENDSIIIMNPQGFRTLKKDKSLNIISFYLKADEEVIRNRLKIRGDNLVESERRLNADKNDFNLIENEVDFVINNGLGFEPEIIAKSIKNLYDNYILCESGDKIE